MGGLGDGDGCEVSPKFRNIFTIFSHNPPFLPTPKPPKTSNLLQALSDWQKNWTFPLDRTPSMPYTPPMRLQRYTITVQLFRNHTTNTIGNPGAWQAWGRSHDHAAREAWLEALKFRLYQYATGMIVTTVSPRGGRRTVVKAFNRPAAPLPPKVFV
jgi:hypothetical protein